MGPIEVLYIVSNNPGKLFQVCAERSKDSEDTTLWIRAVNGHFGNSGVDPVIVSHDAERLTKENLPDHKSIYHCTKTANWQKILKSGLQPGKKHRVSFFSPFPGDDSRNVGWEKCLSECAMEYAGDELVDDDYHFVWPKGGAIMTNAAVPGQYLKHVFELETGVVLFRRGEGKVPKGSRIVPKTTCGDQIT